ncbi:helix-turn-helix domain-containing protein [Thiothrix sp.]|jgi:transcriptional regulator with XRE-family HTH domain|uniref:helix-turn-helix domain-containing protein n=1 Tax=Thiothrix sp. TaxID=1032 RepID=UPI00257951F7|nr:helix-turn-helix domain-containing protein [Thiothrix sp.]
MVSPEQLKTARLNAGLSQEEAAQLLGTSQHSISKNERGEVFRINAGWQRLLLIWPELTDEQKERLLAV